jgi:hypothetical protein
MRRQPTRKHRSSQHFRLAKPTASGRGTIVSDLCGIITLLRAYEAARLATPVAVSGAAARHAGPCAGAALTARMPKENGALGIAVRFPEVLARCRRRYSVLAAC